MSRRPPAPRRHPPGPLAPVRRRWTIRHSLTLALLLLPVILAAIRAGYAQAVLIVYTAMSLLTALGYGTDKRRAETGAWRIPESTLHLAELLGGWPGAYVAQTVFRHKTQKRSFRVLYGLIVAAHLYVAVDYLLNWRAQNAVGQMLHRLFT